MLYKHAQFIGLTNSNTGLPSPGPILNDQAQERQHEKTGITEIAEKVNGNTVILINLLENQVLIGNNSNSLKSEEAQKFYDFLTDHNIVKSLAATIVKNFNIHTLNTLKDLRDAVINKTLL